VKIARGKSEGKRRGGGVELVKGRLLPEPALLLQVQMRSGPMLPYLGYWKTGGRIHPPSFQYCLPDAKHRETAARVRSIALYFSSV